MYYLSHPSSPVIVEIMVALWLFVVVIVVVFSVKLSPLRSISTTINNKLRPKSVGRARVNTGRCHPPYHIFPMLAPNTRSQHSLTKHTLKTIV